MSLPLFLLLTGCTAIVLLASCCAESLRPCGLIGTDIGAPDYGAREMPRQEYGETDRHYRERLRQGHWTFE